MLFFSRRVGSFSPLVQRAAVVLCRCIRDRVCLLRPYEGRPNVHACFSLLLLCVCFFFFVSSLHDTRFFEKEIRGRRDSGGTVDSLEGRNGNAWDHGTLKGLE